MHSHTLDDWKHDHVFLGGAHDRNERRTWFVVGLTAAMMVAEIAGGTIFGSMALLADGWHMSTHAGALAIAAFAYRFARRHARDPRFAFGTGKLGDLAGFASAIVLALVALMIGYESAMRFFQPVPIHYAEATAIAVVGLLVNLLSALLAKQSKGPTQIAKIWNRVFIKSGEASIEQTGSQFAVKLAIRPTFDVFEHHATQQPIRSDPFAAGFVGAWGAFG